MELFGEHVRIDNLKLVKQDIATHMYKEFDCTPKNFEIDSLNGKTHKLNMHYKKLNDYLSDAYNDRTNGAATYVMYNEKEIIGYYTIQMWVTQVTKKYKKNRNLSGDNHVGYPCVDVPFLAINNNYQEKGYGQALLMQLLLNVHWQLVPLIGVNLITLDALNPAVGFYKKSGFIEYSQKRESNVLTSLALDTTQLTQTLKIDTESETEDEHKIRLLLESSLLFDIQ